MTPPTARKRPAATRTATNPVAASSAAALAAGSDVRRFLGADAVTQRPGGRALPGGVTHVVHGWQPVCGERRVRFVFPGASLDDVTEVCDACAGAATRRVPRQRRATTA